MLHRTKKKGKVNLWVNRYATSDVKRGNSLTMRNQPKYHLKLALAFVRVRAFKLVSTKYKALLSMMY